MEKSTVIAVRPTAEERVEERRTLAALEATIERGVKAFAEAGKALLEIRDRELYKVRGLGTWDEYLRERWGWSRAHAYRLMNAAKVARILSPVGDIPAKEAQIRELVPLLDDEAALVEVWRELKEVHGDSVTADRVRAAVRASLVRSSSRTPAAGSAGRAAEPEAGRLTSGHKVNEIAGKLEALALEVDENINCIVSAPEEHRKRFEGSAAYIIRILEQAMARRSQRGTSVTPDPATGAPGV